MARVQLVIRYIYISLFIYVMPKPQTALLVMPDSQGLSRCQIIDSKSRTRPQTVCLSVCLSEEDVNDQARKMDLHKKKKKKKTK